MDRRGRGGRRGRGRPRQAPAREAEPEGSDVGSMPEVPAQPLAPGIEERIAGAIAQAFEAIARGGGLGGPAAQPGGAEDPFYRLFDSFSRLGPPRFSGGNIEAAEEWLASVKDKFQICRAPERHWVELAIHFLENAARFWWDNTKLDFRGDQNVIPWEWFEEQFKEEFIGELRVEEMRQKFMNLKQEGRSVVEYNAEFVNLSRYAPEVRADAKRYRRHYINGLRARIAVAVDHPATQDMRDLMNHAAQVEAHHKREREEQQARNVRPKVERSQSSRDDKGKGPAVKEQAGSKYWCRTCNKPHPEDKCHVRRQACFNCGSTDHWRRECPYPPKNETPRGRDGGGPPQRGGRGLVRSIGGAGGRGSGREGGRIGVHAMELGYNDSGGREGEEEILTSTTSTELLSGTVSISGHLAYVLFDTGCSHSVLSLEFVKRTGWSIEKIKGIKGVCTPLGQFSQIVSGCQNLKVLIAGYELTLDALILDISGYDVLLGFDWLKRHRAVIKCAQRRIQFPLSRTAKQTIRLRVIGDPIPYISAIEARHLLDAGCSGYLVEVMVCEGNRIRSR